MQLLLIECKSPLHLLGPLLLILFGKTSESCQQLFSTTLNFPGLIFVKHFHCHCYMSHSVKFMSQNNLSLEVFESLFFFFFRHFLNFLCLLCPIFVVQRYSRNQSTITVIVLRQDMLKMKKQLKQMTTRSESVYSTRSHYGRLWKDYKKRILVLQCESVQSLSVKIRAVEVERNTHTFWGNGYHVPTCPVDAGNHKLHFELMNFKRSVSFRRL